MDARKRPIPRGRPALLARGRPGVPGGGGLWHEAPCGGTHRLRRRNKPRPRGPDGPGLPRVQGGPRDLHARVHPLPGAGRGGLGQAQAALRSRRRRALPGRLGGASGHLAARGRHRPPLWGQQLLLLGPKPLRLCARPAGRRASALCLLRRAGTGPRDDGDRHRLLHCRPAKGPARGSRDLGAILGGHVLQRRAAHLPGPLSRFYVAAVQAPDGGHSRHGSGAYPAG